MMDKYRYAQEDFAMEGQLLTEKMLSGIRTAFENKNINSDNEYRPKFVFNLKSRNFIPRCINSGH